MTVTLRLSPTGASARRIESASRNAQARAIAERQHGRVARENPWLARLAFAGSVVVTALASGALKGGAAGARPSAARMAPSAEAVSPLSRAIWRASDRKAESARCSERASIPRPAAARESARRSAGAHGEIGYRRRRAEALAEEGEKLPASRP